MYIKLTDFIILYDRVQFLHSQYQIAIHVLDIHESRSKSGSYIFAFHKSLFVKLDTSIKESSNLIYIIFMFYLIRLSIYDISSYYKTN